MKTSPQSLRTQSGIALISTLLLLILMSAMLVGFMLLVIDGQRLSGMNRDYGRAFYGAEAGMEKLTADLGTLFSATYAPTGPQIDALTKGTPSISGVQYADAAGNTSYSIDYARDVKGNPSPAFAQITSGSSPYQGMTALETQYTLKVTARTLNGSEVKLQRTAQTVGIPLFQFGVFSDTDLSFFPGPNFNFGGRVHTNGNLFLASGGPANATPADTNKNQLWLANPVTVGKDIVRDTLSNNHPLSTGAEHPGSVEITTGAGSFQALRFGQGSVNRGVGSGKNPNWSTISGSYNGNVRTGVKPLNLSIVLLGTGSGSRPVDIIRRPVQNEDATNSGVLGERYFSQASLRVLLSDNKNDITSLPCVSAGDPFNLADLAQQAWTSPNAIALQAAMLASSTTPLPLAASGAQAGAYVLSAGGGGSAGGDGYWQPQNTKIITGFIKIDAQTTYGNPCGSWKDVTLEILSLGYAGKNTNPVPQSLDGQTLNPMWGNSNKYTNSMELGASPALPFLPATQMSAQNGAARGSGFYTADSTNAAPLGSCVDPHPNAVIRLERIRDNPSTVPFQPGKLKNPHNLPRLSTVAQVCGVDPATGLPLPGLTPSDFWPNALFDAREGARRGITPALNTQVTLGGVMNYIELDVKNLARWFSGQIGATGASTQDPNIAPNNFVVYISDRRGNYAPAGSVTGVWPPPSPSGNETGEYGFSDFVNPNDINACPNNALDPGEDLDGLGSPNGFFTYGAVTFPPGLVDSTGVSTASTLFQGSGRTSADNSLFATQNDPNCAGPNGGFPWPGTFLKSANEARENPLALFRRSVKLVNGSLINLPICAGGNSCGLTIATENPLYVQGDYNANSAGGGFGDPSVAAGVIADAVTLLSSNWNDINSFVSPFTPAGRSGATTWVRAGVVAGKGASFPIPGWDSVALDGSQDFGTDGGVHNFMRFLENWNATLNYSGSLVSLFYNRQATGLYKGTVVYTAPTRAYNFDTNFLNPSLLPPRTPMIRDINTTGFTQLLLPNQ